MVSRSAAHREGQLVPVDWMLELPPVHEQVEQRQQHQQEPEACEEEQSRRRPVGAAPDADDQVTAGSAGLEETRRTAASAPKCRSSGPKDQEGGHVLRDLVLDHLPARRPPR